MKKFHVKDEDGEVFEVEEIDEAPETVEIEEVKDDLALTDEEISALKGLAAVSEKLMKLVADVEDACKDEEEEEEEKVEDDEEKEEEKIEEVIDSEEDDEEKEAKACDSKKSFGAIESKSKSKDSLADSLDVENAWAKRYGGK